jgi:HlyD family secretion protein
MTRQRRVALIAGVAVVLALVVWFGFLRGGGARDALTASGTVEATEARLGFQAAGRLERVLAREGDRVRLGDTLALLDAAESRARRDQAAAQVSAAQALLRELERGFRSEEIAQARAAWDAARQRLEDAERDLARTRRLHEGGAVSREVYDKAALALDVAVSQHAQAAEQLKLMEAGPRRERVDAQRAQLAQAEGALRALEAALANTVVVAPFDGVVTVRHHEPGEIMAPGTAVLTVMNPDDRWVRIYVKEDRVGAVRLGTLATITSDTYPGREYTGEVAFIASEVEFTPKSVQTTEERVKLVFAVKLRVVGDTAQELKPGMPADVRLTLAP